MKSPAQDRRRLSATAVLFCFLGWGTIAPGANLPQADGRKKIAAGDYEIVRPAHGSQGVGPFSPAVYEFRESFTLWRLQDGTFEAEGRRSYESPKGEAHDNRFAVKLSADMRASEVTDFRKLRFRPNSGPLACEFLEREFACDSGKDSADPKLNVPVKSSYGLFWPASAFSLGRVAIGASRQAGEITPVQLIMIDEPSRENPVAANVLDANLKFLRGQNIRLAGTNWDADEFEIEIPMEQRFLLWTSKDGLVLLFGPEGDSTSGPETGLQLTHYATFN